METSRHPDGPFRSEGRAASSRRLDSGVKGPDTPAGYDRPSMPRLRRLLAGA